MAPDPALTPANLCGIPPLEDFWRRESWLRTQWEETATPDPAYGEISPTGGAVDPLARQQAETPWRQRLLRWRRHRHEHRQATAHWVGQRLLLLHPSWGAGVEPLLGASLGAFWHTPSGASLGEVWHPVPGTPMPLPPVCPPLHGEAEFSDTVEEDALWALPCARPRRSAMDLWWDGPGEAPPAPDLLCAALCHPETPPWLVRGGLCPAPFDEHESLHTDETLILPFSARGPGGRLTKTFAFGAASSDLRVSLMARPTRDLWVGTAWHVLCPTPRHNGAALKIRSLHRESTISPASAGRLDQVLGVGLCDGTRKVSWLLELDHPMWLVHHPVVALQDGPGGLQPVFQGVALITCARVGAGQTLYQRYAVNLVGA